MHWTRCVLAALLITTQAFSPQSLPKTTVRRFSEPGEPEPKAKDDAMEFGVSFMGGVPCASPYNDDPFDEQDSKPDAMAELRRRVKALEDKTAELTEVAAKQGVALKQSEA